MIFNWRQDGYGQMIIGVFLFVIFFQFTGFAQERGTIQFIDRNELGTVDFSGDNPFEIQYAVSPVNFNEKAVAYSAEDLTGFILTHSGQQYVSRKVIDYEKKVFLEILFQGDITLYRIMGGNVLYLLAEEPLRLTPSNFQNNLARQISDCNKEGLYKMQFSNQGIIRFVQEYNKNGSCQIPERMSFGVMAGYSMSSIKIKNSSPYVLEYGSYKSDATSVSIGITFHTPIWSISKMLVYAEVQYASFKFNDSFTSSENDLGIKLNRTHYTLSGGLKYQLFNRSVTPYVLLGPSIELGITNESEYIQSNVDFDNSVIVSQGTDWFDPAPVSYGANYGVGVRLEVISGYPILLEFQGRSLINQDDIGFNSGNINLKVLF